MKGPVVTGRRRLIAGNWKMHLDRAGARSLAEAVTAGVAAATEATEIALFPSHPLLSEVVAVCAGTRVAVGGQDLHPAEQGAYTGEVSGAQLADVGCRYVLCGHSERRRDHGEDDQLVAQKMLAAERVGLIPVVCVGESLERRQAGRAAEVLENQLDALLAVGAPASLVLAYEPVWAIGTGEVATPDIAEEAHSLLRSRFADRLGAARAEALRILYGGSAKPDNVAALAGRQGVDGFLVGGASLDAASFLAIIAGSAPGA